MADKKYEALENELKFVKKQLANALSLYDDMKAKADDVSNAKGSFISKVNHEIRTPMNALVGLSDMLLSMDMNDDAKQCAVDIKIATKSLLHLCTDFIDMSRMQTGTDVLNNLSYSTMSLINRIANTFKEDISDRDVEFLIDIDEKIPSLLDGDSEYIYRAISNIMDYNLEKIVSGKIELKIFSELLENNRVKLTFEIRNHNMKLPKKEFDKVKKSFKSFDTRRIMLEEGLGLRLLMAKNFIKMMQGDIDIEDRGDEGTLFTVHIVSDIVEKRPISKRLLSLVTSDDIKVYVFRNANILVVDDTKVNIKVALGLLKEYDIDADFAESGAAAIEMVKQKDYDIIFMDHMMPEMDGVEAMCLIRDIDKRLAKLPIIALTANVSSESRKMFFEAGMTDFLAKPVIKNELMLMLAKWLPQNKVSFTTKKPDLPKNEISELHRKKQIISGIDMEKGIEYLGGSKTAYIEMLISVVDDSEQKIKLIKEAYNTNNMKNYAIEVHSLKSVAATIGADDLSEMAKEHELEAKVGNEEYVVSNAFEPLSEYEKLVDNIQDYISTMVVEEKNSHDLNEPKLSREEIYSILVEATYNIEDFEIDIASEKINKIMKQDISESAEDNLKQALALLNNFMYEEAAKILRKVNRLI